MSKLEFFSSPSSSLYLKLRGPIQNENTHSPKPTSAFSMTFCQIKTNYKHVVLISNGLSRYCSTLQKILKLSSRISSNPARDWEHVTMLKRFYWYFHFQKPICQVLAGWFADGFVSVTRRVVAGGDRGRLCVPGCATRSTAARPWEMFNFSGQRAGLQHWAGGQRFPSPSQAGPSRCYPMWDSGSLADLTGKIRGLWGRL